jgi:hypothetical protein
MHGLRAISGAALGLLLCLPLASHASGQDLAPANAVQPSQASQADLDRIRAAVSRDPAFKFDESQIRFYLQVLAPAPTFSDFVKDQDLTSGVVADAPMTHREFLDMVTPKELYSAAGIRPTDALQFAITGLVGQIMLQRAFESATDAWRARQIRELNARIDAELAALRERGK